MCLTVRVLRSQKKEGMDLYTIHKLYQGADGSGSYGSTSEKSLWDSHYQDREEFARFLNMMLSAKSPFMNGQRPYDLNYDDSSESAAAAPPVPARAAASGATGTITSSSTDFGFLDPRASINESTSGGAHSRVTLADQFTWGAVVCAGVFIVVFVCVMAAWWVHKKGQERARQRIAQLESSRRHGPYCIENDAIVNPHLEPQRPPSYFEVVGFFDPPPSYSDVLTTGTPPVQAYDNVAVTIDELPPPFVEGENYDVKTVPEIPDAVTVIPNTTARRTSLSS